MMRKLIIILGYITIPHLCTAQETSLQKKTETTTQSTALAYKFNADQNDVVQIPHHEDYDIGTKDFTIEALIKPIPGVNSFPQILSNRNSTNVGFLFGLWNDGRPYMRIKSANYFYNTGSGNDLRDGACHHVTFTRSNSIISLYIDGVLDASVTIPSSISSPHDLWIGNDFQSSNVAFNGNIQEVKFWNTSRSIKEIEDTKAKALIGTEIGLIGYWRLNETDTQKSFDLSSNQNHGTLGTSVNSETTDPTTSTVSCSVEESINKELVREEISATSYYFNSSQNDVIEVPHHDVYNISTGSFTIEATINAKETGNSYPQILSNRSSTDVGFLFGLWSDGRPYMRIKSANYFYNMGSGLDLRDGACHHIAFTRNGSEIYLYVDGILDAMITSPSSISSPHDLWIGNDFQNSNVAFEGAIKEVRLWNKGRSGAEILDNKDLQLEGSEIGLIGYWKLDEDDQNITDYSINQNPGVLGSSTNLELKDPDFYESCNKVTSIESPFLETEISIFPNPSTSTININGASEQYLVSIYNVQGQIMINTRSKTINIESFEPGLYFVHINDNVIKVVKK
jgi:hypothetical protein